MFVHVDDLKLCPGPQDISWVPGVPTAKSLCASTVAFRPGSRVSDTTPDPSGDVSGWDDMNDHNTSSTVIKDLTDPLISRDMFYRRFISATSIIRTADFILLPT